MVISQMCDLLGWNVEVATSAWNKVFVAFDGRGGLVMRVMSSPPCIVRHEKELITLLDRYIQKKMQIFHRVHSVPKNMVDRAVLGERSVTRFMAKYPPATKDETLEVPVETPKRPLSSEGYGRRQRELLSGRLDSGVNQPAEFINYHRSNNVPSSDRKSLDGALFMEVLGHGGMQLCQGGLGILLGNSDNKI